MAVVPPLPAPEPSTLMRYQRVRDILDRAAAGSTASYQGYGPFWRLPYGEFLEFSLYGVRMIAPGPDRPKARAQAPSTSPSLARARPWLYRSAASGAVARPLPSSRRRFLFSVQGPPLRA